MQQNARQVPTHQTKSKIGHGYVQELRKYFFREIAPPSPIS